MPLKYPHGLLPEWARNGWHGVSQRWGMTDHNARRRVKRLVDPRMLARFGPPPWTQAQYDWLRDEVIRHERQVEELT